jgi:hypothetical protein
VVFDLGDPVRSWRSFEILANYSVGDIELMGNAQVFFDCAAGAAAPPVSEAGR